MKTSLCPVSLEIEMSILPKIEQSCVLWAPFPVIPCYSVFNDDQFSPFERYSEDFRSYLPHFVLDKVRFSGLGVIFFKFFLAEFYLQLCEENVFTTTSIKYKQTAFRTDG